MRSTRKHKKSSKSSKKMRPPGGKGASKTPSKTASRVPTLSKPTISKRSDGVLFQTNHIVAGVPAKDVFLTRKEINGPKSKMIFLEQSSAPGPATSLTTRFSPEKMNAAQNGEWVELDRANPEDNIIEQIFEYAEIHGVQKIMVRLLRCKETNTPPGAPNAYYMDLMPQMGQFEEGCVFLQINWK
jgi:hypothetical protein